MTKLLLALALMATAARADSVNVSARLNCNGAFDMTLREPSFSYFVDAPFGERCPTVEVATLGAPVSFIWDHSILPMFPPLDYSFLLGSDSGFLAATITGVFEVVADFPFSGFFSGPISWNTTGKMCPDDPKLPCVDFKESGTGVGNFGFELADDGKYALDFGAVSTVPEPSSLWLLALALAFIVRRRLARRDPAGC